MWQDAVFTVGSVLFFVSLLPALRDGQKPPVKTSLLTGVVLSIYAVTMATLELYWTAFANAAVAAQWLTLAVQRWKQ